jgi:hypothetical protein
MNDDYLWDQSGQPDPETVRLEETLAPFRYRTRPLDLQRAPRHVPRGAAGKAWRWMAAAAAIVAGAIAVRLMTPPVPPTGWRIDRTAGMAQVGREQAIVSSHVLHGDVLRTGAGAEIALSAEDIGRIEIGPQSEVRASTDRQVTLNRGMLHAFIWAPPREFVVNTPSSRAVDLGCEYTLNVDAAGDGLVHVLLGWVAFQFHDNESFIPAGAECITRRTAGPGIPFYEDAPEALRTSLARFERGDAGRLGGILASARPRDGITLWHLLTRVSAQDREAVFDRFAQLVPLPAEVTREGMMRKDGHMIDLCWNALNLENTDWWRGWERRWN